MGGGSKSQTSTAQSTTNIQDIDTTTIGLDNIGEDALAVAGVSGDVSVTQISTDSGALEAGRKIGEAAFDFAGEQSSEAFDFGRDSLKTLEGGIDRSFDFGSDTVSDAFDFGSKALDSVRASTQESVSELGRSIQQVASATRSDSSLAAETIVKYIAIAVAVVAGAYFLFGRK